MSAEHEAAGVPILEAVNLSVSYSLKGRFLRTKRFCALKDISFQLNAGEALGIIGRNGVGKSTLLQVLAGIISPDSGKVIRRAKGITLLSLQIGFVEYLTGRENAVLSAMLQGMRKKDIERSLDRVCEFSELGAFFDQQLMTYSTGMKARLGFAVALELDPEVLLIDEVTSVGDASFQQKSYNALTERLHGNRSLVLVSHAPWTIKQLCSRTIWIEQGIIKMAGPSDEVLAEYEAHLLKAS